MIDLHAHILPGFDDGVRSIEEARDLARAAAAEGVTAIAATPHVRGDYPTSVERMLRGVSLLRADFEREQIDVEVLSGGELDVERLWQLSPEAVRRFTLAGTGRWLLLETPYAGWPPRFDRQLEALQQQGLRVLLAHPERNAEVQADASLLAPLVRAGMRVQVTAASLDGRLGSRPLDCARRLLAEGLVHVLATDAHAPSVREGGLRAAVSALDDLALGLRLTVDNPAAIVAGDDVPA